MEVRSRDDEHPGGQVITNDSHALISIPLKRTLTAIGDYHIFYIFICPIFSFSTTPIRSNSSDNLEQAPFAIACDGKRVVPAYFIRHGQVHYGFQVFSRAKLSLTIYLDINLRFLQASNQFCVYELVQFILYGQDGGHEPLDVKFMVICHPHRNPPLCRRLDPPRTEPLYPLPYFQSPLPQRGSYFPDNLTVGNEVNMFYGKYYDFFNNDITISMYPFEVKPQLSYVTSRFLRSLTTVAYFGPFWTEILFYSPPTIFDIAIMTEQQIPKPTRHQYTQTDPKNPIIHDASTQFDEDPIQLNMGFTTPPLSNLEEIEELMDIKVNPLSPDDQVIKNIFFLILSYLFFGFLAVSTGSSGGSSSYRVDFDLLILPYFLDLVRFDGWYLGHPRGCGLI